MPRPALLPLVLLLGCAPVDDDKEALATRCDETRSPLGALDAASPLGVSGADAVALAGGTFTGVLEWETGSESALTLTVAPAETATFVESRPSSDGSIGTEEAAACASRVEVDVTVTLRTDDGLLDEVLEGTIAAYDATQATFWHDLSSPRGQVDLEDYAEDGATDIDARLDIVFGELTIDGDLEGTATYEDPDCEGDDCAVSASSFDVAEFELTRP
jgi:hypothetical protein